MKKCHTCKKEIIENRIFCDVNCYFKRNKYRQHTEETKQKIAIGNSKPMTVNRKLAISDAKTYKPSQELLEKLDYLWSFGYINKKIIRELAGVGPCVYKRLFKEYCKIEQYKFMPSNWYPEHYQKLIELSAQNIWYKQISKLLGFCAKQIFLISKKLNLNVNTHNPNAYESFSSKPEALVISWIKNEKYNVSTQFPLGNFLFDGHIHNTNILIEVHGDYWHCNPKVYKNGPINEMQKANIRRDFAKKAHAKNQGYYLVTIWEKDINDDLERIKNWIINKIQLNLITEEIKNEQ